MKEYIKKNAYVIAIAVIAIVLIGYIYLDNTKQAHDLPFHLANINNIVANGLKVSPIMPNLAGGLGYGLYIFYPMLPHYFYSVIASALSCINVEIIDSILITNILVSIISAITMYILVLNLSNNKKWAFLSAIIYLLFPYRLGTITVRMALTENFTSIFIPIILLSVHFLMTDEKKKFYISFIIGYTGLILSHYIIAMYFSLFMIIILLFYIDKLLKNKRILTLAIGVLSVTILVLPNIIIFAEHYEQDYLVYKENYVTNFALIKKNILSLKDYIMPTEDYNWTIPYYIYITVAIMALYSIYLTIKENKRKGILALTLITTSVLMMSCTKIWEIFPKMTYNIQFPWRILLMLSVFISVIAPKYIGKFNKKGIFIATTILCVLPSILLINKLNNRIYHKDYTKIELEKGTGNLSEYYPSRLERRQKILCK